MVKCWQFNRTVNHRLTALEPIAYGAHGRGAEQQRRFIGGHLVYVVGVKLETARNPLSIIFAI